MIQNICFDMRSTRFKFFKIVEIFESETEPAIHIRFEAPISTNITNLTNSVAIETVPQKNDSFRLLQEVVQIAMTNFSEIGTIQNITIDDSRSFITIHVEPANSKNRQDVTISPAHNFFYA